MPSSAFDYDNLSKSSAAFMGLLCLANFFQNFGPNTTTFIVPGEIFPTRYRSTAHGISAASGKFGAVISQIVFAITTGKGVGTVYVPRFLYVFASLNVCIVPA